MRLFFYGLRRLAASLPLLLFLPFLTFCLMHLVPGNFFDVLRLNPQISPETIRRYEDLYHLREPLWSQYFHWLSRIVQLDFGYSFSYQQPVLQLLGSRFWNTFLLTGTSFLLAWTLAVATGLYAGVRPSSFSDRLLCAAAYAGLSIPGFFLCLLLMAAVLQWGGLPLGGMRHPLYQSFSPFRQWLDLIAHMAVPVGALTFSTYAYLFRFMRAQTLEVAGRDFVFYLRAMRVPESRVVFRHIARNALNPMVSLFGLELPALFSGAALVEILTGWPGLGSMMLQAVRAQDLFLVLGNMLILSVLLVAGNWIADLLILVLDPRIRLQGEKVS